jgi:[acyl-carrier-protein] S-malonyltransferase
LTEKIALLFAGQGSQTPGMGAALRESCGDCRATFAAADEALQMDLSGLMAGGSAPELRLTAIAQPALLTLSVAQARHLLERGLEPAALAGHSLGQFSALVTAGAIDFADSVRLVHQRGLLMQATVPEGDGAMTAIVGLDTDEVEAKCIAARSHGVVDVACYNSPGQVVISGSRAAVDAAAAACEDEGGGAVRLEVSVPFHCSLLEPMLPAFASLVDALALQEPCLPVIDNVTALPLTDAASVRASLVAQVTAPVRFAESLAWLSEAGCKRFVQCGPGNAPLGFAKRVAPGGIYESLDQALVRLQVLR